METITIKGHEYRVERNTDERARARMPYFLHGKRNAVYGCMRLLDSPDTICVIKPHNAQTVAWLTDKHGTLEAIG